MSDYRKSYVRMGDIRWDKNTAGWKVIDCPKCGGQGYAYDDVPCLECLGSGVAYAREE